MSATYTTADAFGNRMASTAQRLIASNGQAVTLTPTGGPGAFDAATLAFASTMGTPVVLPAIVAPARKRFINGELVVTGEMTFLVAGRDLANAPKPGDAVLLRGASFEATSVEAAWAGAVVATYLITGRAV